ncbi:hypothetical protein MYMA111404_02635 [Mycoplasma marinum]
MFEGLIFKAIKTLKMSFEENPEHIELYIEWYNFKKTLLKKHQ